MDQKKKSPAHTHPYNGSEGQPASSFLKKMEKYDRMIPFDTCCILQVFWGYII